MSASASTGQTPSLAPQPQPPSAPASRWGKRLAALANPSRRACAWAMLILLAAGTAYRLQQYLAARSFWRDEAYLLINNIMDKSAAQLLGRLDNAQSAPPLFLLALRGLYVQFGASELALRLVPIACGILGLWVFALLAWRILRPGPAAWAVGFMAFCDELIFHATSMKQYTGDAMATAILLLLAVWVARSARPGRAFLVLAMAASVLAWCSLTTAFVFAGLSLALLARLHAGQWRGGEGGGAGAGGRGRWRAMVPWIIGNALFAASALTLYFQILRWQPDPSLYTFWAEDLADYSRPWTIPWFILRESYRLCEVVCRPVGPLLTLLVLAGMWNLWREKQRTILAILLGPILMTILAACLRQYPYHGGRLTVFLLPPIMLLAAFGLQSAMSLRGRASTGARAADFWWLPGLIVVLLSFGMSVPNMIHPMGRSQIRPIVRYVQAHRQRGDAIYLIGEGPNPRQPAIGGGSVEFLCYWRTPQPPLELTMPADVRQIPYQRFWVTFVFLPRHKGTRYLDPYLDQIRTIADEKDRLVDLNGGAAFLFQKR